MLALEIPSETLTAYRNLKMKRTHRWIIFKIEDNSRVVVESSGEPTSTFAEFAEKLPEDQPRYAVYDMPIQHKDGCKLSKLLLFLYAPDCGVAKVKFVYAIGKQAFKNKLGTMNKEFQVIYIRI